MIYGAFVLGLLAAWGSQVNARELKAHTFDNGIEGGFQRHLSQFSYPNSGSPDVSVNRAGNVLAKATANSKQTASAEDGTALTFGQTGTSTTVSDTRSQSDADSASLSIAYNKDCLALGFGIASGHGYADAETKKVGGLYNSATGIGLSGTGGSAEGQAEAGGSGSLANGLISSSAYANTASDAKCRRLAKLLKL